MDGEDSEVLRFAQQFLSRASGSGIFREREKELILKHFPTWADAHAINTTPAEWERLGVPMGLRNRITQKLATLYGDGGQGCREVDQDKEDKEDGVYHPKKKTENEGLSSSAPTRSNMPHWDSTERRTFMIDVRTRGHADSRWPQLQVMHFHTNRWGEDFLLIAMNDMPKEKYDFMELVNVCQERQEYMGHRLKGAAYDRFNRDFLATQMETNDQNIQLHLVADAITLRNETDDQINYYLDLECGNVQFKGNVTLRSKSTQCMVSGRPKLSFQAMKAKQEQTKRAKETRQN